MFNEKGYHMVSLRDIADELSISKGNLTYYFKKKEDLFEACAVRNHADYRKPDVPQTLKALNDFFVMLLTRKADKPYYFQNYSQLAEVCPKVYAIQRSVIDDFSDVINQAIHNLTIAGLFRQDCSFTYPNITQCILTVITYDIVPC